MPRLVTQQYAVPKRQPPRSRETAETKLSPARLYRSVTIANLGGVLVGIHLVLFSGILEMPHFARTLGTRTGGFLTEASISPMTKSIITSSLIVSLMLACPLAGVLVDQIGRRRSLLLMAMLFAAASTATLHARTVRDIILARVVAGMAYAIATIAIPLYTAEISPPKRRGALINLYQVTIAVGILFAQTCNIRYTNAEWTAPVSLSLLPALAIFFAILAGVPESPVWLSTRQHTAKGGGGSTNASGSGNGGLPLPAQTLDAAERRNPAHRRSETALSIILSDKSSRRRLAIGAGLAMAQQWCGINAVFFYAPAIIKDVLQWEGTEASLHAAAGVGFINVIATSLAAFAINWTGRRTLLLGGAPVMATSLVIIGAMRDQLVARHPMVGVGALLVYVAAFALTYGPVSFVVASEIFPPRYSGICMSFCVGVMGLCSATVGLTFLPLLESIGGSVFFLFAGFLVLSTIFVWYMVPETKDMTLQQIDQLLDGSGSR